MSSTKCAQQSLLEQPNKYHNMDQVCNWQSCPELPFIQCLGICYANKCLLSLIPTCLKRCCSIQDYETIFTPDDKNLSTTCCVSCQHFGRLWEWEWWRAYLQSQCDFFPLLLSLRLMVIDTCHTLSFFYNIFYYWNTRPVLTCICNPSNWKFKTRGLGAQRCLTT